jgi:P4 family phage/plasmid primase-like protien
MVLARPGAEGGIVIEGNQAAQAYVAGGWSPIPLPARAKSDPPAGLTGWRGRYLTDADLGSYDWSGNIALRLPPEVVGVDVDAYAGGDVSLKELEQRFGPLPETVMSTSRTDGSGIRLFQVPAGTTLHDKPAEGIEMIQAHHRYVVCAPSIHPEGRPYQWIDEASGEVLDTLPFPGEMPALPWAWVEGLTVHKTGAGVAATPDQAREFIDTHCAGDLLVLLDAAIAKLDGVQQGGRHDALVSTACWVGREAAAGWYPAEVAIDRLHEWWMKAVASDQRRRDGGEFGAAVLWAIGQALAEPDRIAAMRAKVQAPSVGTAVNLDNSDNWADNLLGEVLADELHPEWLYVTAWRQWMRWDGRRWAGDQTEAVHEVARQWMGALGEQALKKVTTRKDPLVGKVFQYRHAPAMENLVKVARRILAVEPTAFDRDAHLLNVHNGVVDLRTGQLGPHDPALMMTKLAGAAYDPRARHPDIFTVFGCLDSGDINSMRMLLGVAATGHTGGDHLPVFDGTGGNGKTTLLLAASAALGDYAGPVPPELVMRSSREDHPTIKTALQGLRLAYVEETEEDGGLRLERVKAITGGAPISGRRIGGNYYSFLPSHTLVLATNHRPNVNSAEHAAWRRLHLIPFPHRYGTAPGDQQLDAGLRDRVRLGQRQRETMLAVIVLGAQAGYAAGEPDSPMVEWSTGIAQATDSWRADEDIIWRFAGQELYFDADLRVTLAQMFTRYKQWCEGGNRPSGQDKLFARRFEAHDIFRDHGVKRIAPQNRVAYIGVGLR